VQEVRRHDRQAPGAGAGIHRGRTLNRGPEPDPYHEVHGDRVAAA